MEITIEKEVLDDDKGLLFRFFENEERISFDAAIGLLQTSDEFRNFLSEILAQTPYEAFNWECRPVSVENVDLGFEFVVMPSSSLAKQADATAFNEHFNDDLVVSFANLGNDATLVAPTPQKGKSYAHFAEFLRTAPKEQIQALWEMTAIEFENNLGMDYAWLNTAGHGVPWLHIRIDSVPKYYQYQEYKKRYKTNLA